MDKILKLFSNFIGIILFAALFTFFTRNIFNDDNAIFVINDMGCERWNCGFAFTIHAHS